MGDKCVFVKASAMDIPGIIDTMVGGGATIVQILQAAGGWLILYIEGP